MRSLSALCVARTNACDNLGTIAAPTSNGILGGHNAPIQVVASLASITALTAGSERA